MTTHRPGFSPTYWRDRWREQKHALFSTPGYENPVQYWNTKKNVTELYLKSRNRTSWQEKSAAQLAAMKIPAGARVLDIGGGAGTLAIPLALQGCALTIVEPSAAMREELEAHWRAAGLTSPTVIPRCWEEIPLKDLGGPFDAVIASYSLAMEDIGEALEKMDACCRGTVHLFWFLTPRPMAVLSRALWPYLHGAPFPGEPKADCLWQVLYEMGIYAGMAVERKEPTVYRTIDEAIDQASRRLNCTTPRQREILSAYFSTVLCEASNGFVLPGDAYSAHIWWNREMKDGELGERAGR
jgi:ubiquinone/menaquinone biosynthesis C-methylase UbiE